LVALFDSDAALLLSHCNDTQTFVLYISIKRINCEEHLKHDTASGVHIKCSWGGVSLADGGHL